MSRFAAILFCVVVPLSCAPAVDFTPRVMQVNADGIAIKRTYFADGDAKIGLKVGPDVELSAQNGGALFRFKTLSDASMLWRQSPFTPEAAFDDAHLPQYAAVAVQFLPQGSTVVKIESEEADVYPINHWVCHRYTITSGFYGVPMRDTVTFLNISNTEQIVIHVSARASDFKKAEALSWDILRSWHDIDPALEKPFN